MSAWRKLAQKIDQRSARERWLITGTALAILVLLTDQIVLQTLLGDRSELRSDLRTIETHIRTQNEELARLQATLARDPNVASQRELDQLQRQIVATESEIAAATSRLVDPKQMAGVLRSMLERADGLQLIALQNHEPQPLEVATEESDPETDAFRHSLRIELQGSFNDTLTYLQQLEALPWDFFWENLEITAGEYPQNRITIEIYTISIGRRWLGV